MFLKSVRFLNSFSAAIVAGIVFGVWLGFNPRALSFNAYVEQQQNLIRSLNELMPLLGRITIAITLVNAFMNRRNRPALIYLSIASICFIAAGLITAYGNQVINAEMINWNPQSPRSDWMILRERWWTLHSVRTLTSLVGLALIIWATTSDQKG